VVSRSFIAKLKKVYPDSSIDVFYLKQQPSDDQLDLLPVDKIETHLVDVRVPLLTRWFNKIYWRLFHLSLNERHVQKQYGSHIAKINYQKYDHIFIRSCGVEYEAILGAIDLPILKKSIINFHDPYPLFWCSGNDRKLTSLELFRLKTMSKVVHQAKACITPAMTLTKDLGYLYGRSSRFFTLPHQYEASVFNLSDSSITFEKNKKLTICYQGAIQFGRDISPLLNAYQHLLETNEIYREATEFIIRVKKTVDIDALNNNYSISKNIIVLGPTDFSNSSYEQKYKADINIILENGVDYCNILVGKAPFLSSLNKPILSISPDRSDLRMIIKEDKYICSNKNEVELILKLESLIKERLSSKEPVFPFGDYFSDENFKTNLDAVLFRKELNT
jgi:hypothetical protein